LTNYFFLCYIIFSGLTGQSKNKKNLKKGEFKMSKNEEKEKEEGKEFNLERVVSVVLGAITKGEEGIKKLVDELEKKGELRKKEAKKAIDDLIKKGKKEREELTKTIDDRISEITKKLGIVTKKDLERIIAKVEKLEKKAK